MGMGAKPIYQTKSFGMDRPFFAKFRKHICARCGTRLSLVKVTHYQIKKGSIEYQGKIFKFDILGHPVDYTFLVFECEKCGNKLSINDQYYIEKPRKMKSKCYSKQLLTDDYRVYLQSQDRKNGGDEYRKYLENLNKQTKEIQILGN